MISFASGMNRNRSLQKIEKGIYLIRGQRVMLDSDLAEIYGVSTKRLNEQLKRNRRRFPKDFAFQLNESEVAALRSQIATSNARGGRRYRPWVFTEHGAIMLANKKVWERPQCRDLTRDFSRTIGALRPLPHS